MAGSFIHRYLLEINWLRDFKEAINECFSRRRSRLGGTFIPVMNLPASNVFDQLFRRRIMRAIRHP
jgi:hypothetical protein